MSRIRTLSVIAAAVALAGCSGAGKIFGFQRGGPDEFTVVRNQPLSMPPDATLRPPQQGPASAERDLSSDRARESLLASVPEGEADPTGAPITPQFAASVGQSPGELALAQRVAAYYGVEPEIRRIVNSESRQLVLEQDSFLNKILFWQDPPPAGTTLDAAAEYRRLRENEALGKPVNSGTAPVIVRKRSGISSLF